MQGGGPAQTRGGGAQPLRAGCRASPPSEIRKKTGAQRGGTQRSRGGAPPALPAGRGGTPRATERGAALLVAIVAIAVLTALAVDLSYETQVRLRIAANARDELRAEMLAQSAVNVSRLVLGFQNQIDQAMAAACPPQATSGTSGGTATTAACPRPQLWNIVPVSSALTQSLFGDAGAGASARGALPAKASSAEKPEGGAPALATTSLGDFDGGFQARIEDEGQKINAQLTGLELSGFLGSQVEALLRMVCETRWDPLFDRTDADGQRYSRADLIVNLRNWVSDDNTGAALKASFPGGNCSFIVPPSPFEHGFADKNFPYDRGTDRYRTKNAPMDSVEELHLVAGVTDAFMAAFGDQLTVYLNKNGGGINVNSDDPRQQLVVAWLLSDPTSLQIKLSDPKFLENYHKALTAARMGGFVTITATQVRDILQSLGVATRTDVALTGDRSPFTDRSLVFRIRALGVAGDVTHDTEAVVTFDPGQIRQMTQTTQNQTQPRQQLGAAAGQLNMGQLIHWHED